MPSSDARRTMYFACGARGGLNGIHFILLVPRSWPGLSKKFQRILLTVTGVCGLWGHEFSPLSLSISLSTLLVLSACFSIRVALLLLFVLFFLSLLG